MTNILMHIAQRALNRPLLVTPDKAQVILSVLAGRIGVNTPDASRFVGSDLERDAQGRPVRRLPYNRTADGVAVVTITGALVNRGAWLGESCDLTSYEGIKHQIAAAKDDPQAHSILLDIDSPGGEAVGAMECAQAVRDAGKSKKVVAVVNGMACSAAYAIASAANEIVTTETGVSGSIGVVLLHADHSAELKEAGVAPTLIFAGAHKVDGNPFEPLSDAVRSDLQQEVNAFYSLFIKTVAKGRGSRLNTEAARATEARSFIGQAAVDIGLADRVGTFESALSDLSRASGRSTSQAKGASMSSETTQTPAADAGIPKATYDAAVATATAEGHKAGAAAERERVAAILTHAEADGRAATAQTLALETDMSAEQAGKVLASTPKAAARGGLEARQTQNPANTLGGAPATATQREPAVLNPAAIFEKRRAAAAGNR